MNESVTFQEGQTIWSATTFTVAQPIVTDVVMAPGQFASPYNGEISPEVVQAVWAVFNEGMSVFEIPTTHFHADYVSPYWAEKKVSRGTIDRHLFYGE